MRSVRETGGVPGTTSISRLGSDALTAATNSSNGVTAPMPILKTL